MADHDKLFMDMVAICEENIPRFSVRFKEDYWHQRLIGFILRWIIPFNRRYMTDFTTTFSPYVYFPSRAWLAQNKFGAFKVLCHEYVHLYDEKKRGSLDYKFSYMRPQIFGLLAFLSLLAFVNSWALCFLFFLLPLLPLPASGRRDIERRGYLMSMAVNFWRFGTVYDSQILWITKHFTGSAYYFMWPFRKGILDRIKHDLQSLSIDEGTTLVGWPGDPYRHVHTLLSKHGLLMELAVG